MPLGKNNIWIKTHPISPQVTPERFSLRVFTVAFQESQLHLRSSKGANLERLSSLTDQTHSLRLALAFHEEVQLEKPLCLQLAFQTLCLIISVADTPTRSCPPKDHDLDSVYTQDPSAAQKTDVANAFGNFVAAVVNTLPQGIPHHLSPALCVCVCVSVLSLCPLWP